jgi:hypothetical protein
MPDYLHLPMLALTLMCDVAPIFSGARGRFHKLPLPLRLQFVSQWKASRYSVCRDFVRFHESLSVFGCAAEREEAFSRSIVS